MEGRREVLWSTLNKPGIGDSAETLFCLGVPSPQGEQPPHLRAGEDPHFRVSERAPTSG